MTIRTIEITKINPAPYNPRKDLQPDDLEYQKLKKSIDKFGLVEPLIWNKKTGNLVGGHQRLKILQDRGDQKVSVSVVDLDDADEKALNLALNKISGEWDEGKLAELLGELSELPDFDIELTGFDVDEVANLQPSKEAVDDNFNTEKALDAIDEPVTKLGDIILLGKHRLMCGDSTEMQDVELLMDGQKADMVFTDPPYGIDVVQNETIGGSKELGFVGNGGGSIKAGKNKIVDAKKYHQILGDNTIETARLSYQICEKLGFKNLIFWGGNYFSGFLPPSSCWIIWDKENTGNFADVEMAWTSYRRGARLYKWLWNGLSRKGDRKTELSSRVHPTQKPVGLHGAIIIDFTKEQDILTDFFAGSGVLFIAAEQLNRICYGMELDPKYCDVITKRWEEFTGKKAIRP